MFIGFKLKHSYSYFNVCTVHLLIFCTMTNKCTIISQIITFLHASTLSCHPQGACNPYLAKLSKYLIVNCITNSCIWNTCATGQNIEYKLPEDDTIVSKHAKSVIICEILVHLLVILQKKSFVGPITQLVTPGLLSVTASVRWCWGTERSERRGGFSPRNRYARHCNAVLNTDNLRVSSQEETDRTKPLSLHGDAVCARVSPRKTLAYHGNKLRGSQHQILFLWKTSTITSEIMSLLTKIIPYDRAKLGHT